MKSFAEEIQQDKFRFLSEKVVFNTIYTTNWLRDKGSPIFKEYDIKQQHYNILRIVRGRKGAPASPSDILKVMIDKGRDLTRLVDKLVKLGYLDRRLNESNRRKMDIFITEKGTEVLNELDVKLYVFFQDSFPLSDEECETLNYLLDKMRS